MIGPARAPELAPVGMATVGVASITTTNAPAISPTSHRASRFGLVRLAALPRLGSVIDRLDARTGFLHKGLDGPGSHERIRVARRRPESSAGAGGGGLLSIRNHAQYPMLNPADGP